MTQRITIAVAAALCATALAGRAAAEDFTVAATDLTELKAVYGEVRSRHELPARARIGGTIAEISVTEGSEVAKGEIIAKVVDDKLALQLDAAESEIKALNAQLENARLDLERAQKLLETGATTKARVDQLQTQVDVLISQLSAAESKRAVVAQQAAEGEILAPDGGRILSVPMTPGSVVLGGDTIATIAGGGYFLRLSLPERHANEITEGNEVTVGANVLTDTGTPDPATARTGKLVKVYPEIASGRVTADVEVDGLGTYFVGERTLVWVPVAHRQVLGVPPAAVSTRHGVDYVRIAGKDGEIDVAVILGERFRKDDRDLVEVLTGLEAGDKVMLP